MKKLISIFTLIFIVGCEKSEPYQWHRNVLFESVLNQVSNKVLLLDFETEWCVWCKKLDENTYTDQRVKNFAKNFYISMKIDAEKGEGIET